MKLIKSTLNHILFILSGIFITFLILDSYNPTMNFVGNVISLKLLWGFCILTVANFVLTLIQGRNKNPNDNY